MNQVPIFPATTTTVGSTAAPSSVVTEPPSYTADAANPDPIIAPSTSNHPPYDKMIHTAITALNERNGSSKRAIAKYIEQIYSDQLPPTHSALLTHHLTRLKTSGDLVMVKKSYKLPRSDDDSAVATDSPTMARPRRRGRPARPKLTTEPVSVSLGPAGDESVVVKRTPGRPPKTGAADVAQKASVLGKRGRGRPPGSKSKISAVRPPKPKRGRGRPPKSDPRNTPIPIPYAGVATAIVPLLPNVGEGVNMGLSNQHRPRGRPRGSGATGASVGLGGVNGGVVYMKRPGRPPKVDGVRRPVGRPKKNASTVIEDATTNPQLVICEQLKRKLQFFQSKVKEAVGVVKPYFGSESGAIGAIEAIRELELLSNLDINV